METRRSKAILIKQLFIHRESSYSSLIVELIWYTSIVSTTPRT